MENYNGIWRRFERLGEIAGKSVISDYAHHPSAIAATLQAVREFYPGKKVFLVFQPHQYDRTKKLFGEFVAAFMSNPPDGLLISEIFDVAGRDEDDKSISSRDFLVELSKKITRVFYSATLTDTERQIREKLQDYDIILVMGAGDIYQVAENLVKK